MSSTMSMNEIISTIAMMGKQHNQIHVGKNYYFNIQGMLKVHLNTTCRCSQDRRVRCITDYNITIIIIIFKALEAGEDDVNNPTLFQTQK